MHAYVVFWPILEKETRKNGKGGATMQELALKTLIQKEKETK
jgi:hypothetical protein